jgi:hypothetical protein
MEEVLTEIERNGWSCMPHFIGVSESLGLLRACEASFAQGEFKQAGVGRRPALRRAGGRVVVARTLADPRRGASSACDCIHARRTGCEAARRRRRITGRRRRPDPDHAPLGKILAREPGDLLHATMAGVFGMDALADEHFHIFALAQSKGSPTLEV